MKQKTMLIGVEAVSKLRPRCAKSSIGVASGASHGPKNRSGRPNPKRKTRTQNAVMLNPTASGTDMRRLANAETSASAGARPRPRTVGPKSTGAARMRTRPRQGGRHHRQFERCPDQFSD
jgi:hypothetical protein